MLSLIVVYLIALCAEGRPEVQTVCASNHCVGTKTNPIPRGEKWISGGMISNTGCCFGWKGGCETCYQPYSCYQYGEGEDDAWCERQSVNSQESGIVWTDVRPDRPDVFPGCGWCSCCQKTDPKTGLPVNLAPIAGGTTGDVKALWSTGEKIANVATQMGVKVPAVSAVEAMATAETESFHAFDLAVYGFATIGFTVVVFGAYQHYSGKTHQETSSIL